VTTFQVLLVAGIVVSWIVGFAFMTGPLVRHMLWKRWQRRHGGEITHWGKERL
jgi:hypothetical protein